MNKAAKMWTVISVSLLVLAFTTWLATHGQLVLGEEKVLSIAYNLPEELRLFFLFVTLLGSPWVLAIVLCSLLIKERFDIAFRLILASSVTFLITGLAKYIVGRPRPGLLVDILQREILVFGNGFPSAHVALATAIALILGAYMPKKRTNIIIVWIGVVAISRLYLGVHAPLDIVGGFCIGALSTTTVLAILPPTKNISKIRVAKSRRRA